MLLFDRMSVNDASLSEKSINGFLVKLNSSIIKELSSFEHCPHFSCHYTARLFAATSDDYRIRRNRLKRQPQALNLRLDIRGNAQVHDQHMVLAMLDLPLQCSAQSHQAHLRQLALKYGKLQPFPIAFHDFEHLAPSSVAANIIADDIQVIVHAYLVMKQGYSPISPLR